MRIIITKSTSPNYWYSSMIGTEFEVVRINNSKTCYIVKYADLPSSCKSKLLHDDDPGILIKDADIVEDLPSIPEKSTISELFEQKVQQLRGNSFHEGEKVHYHRFSFIENGIVKSVPDNEHAFVVYKWGDNPDEYQKYTGVLTALKHLKRGWHDNIHSERSTSEGNGNN